MDLSAIKIDQVVDIIKNQLGVKNTHILGLDIGLSAIKLVELIPSGSSYKLTKFISVPLPEAALIEDEIQKEPEIRDAIKLALKNIGAKHKDVCLGLFGPNSVVRKIQLPGGTVEEIEDQVIWEAEQYLPFPVEDSNIDQYIIGENEGGGVDVIVGAVRKDLLETFKALLEGTGGKVRIVDLSALALSNVFEMVAAEEIEENPTSSWLIMDVGAQKTICVIYKRGIPMFTKEIPIGGAMITEEIQRQLGVNFREAEDLKIIQDDSGNLPEEVSVIISELNTRFVSEIKKMLDFYVTSTSDDSLKSCYVTGGSIQLPGLLEGITQNLGVDVNVINPFKVIEVDKKFSDEELNYIAYCGCVAIGLGMRKLDK